MAPDRIKHVLMRSYTVSTTKRSAKTTHGTNIQTNTLQPLGQLQILEYDGCAPEPGDLGVTQDQGTELLWLPAGPVEDIRIRRACDRGWPLRIPTSSMAWRALRESTPVQAS